jgi:hypothetical protein
MELKVQRLGSLLLGSPFIEGDVFAAEPFCPHRLVVPVEFLTRNSDAEYPLKSAGRLPLSFSKRVERMRTEAEGMGDRRGSPAASRERRGPREYRRDTGR